MKELNLNIKNKLNFLLPLLLFIAITFPFTPILASECVGTAGAINTGHVFPAKIGGGKNMMIPPGGDLCTIPVYLAASIVSDAAIYCTVAVVKHAISYFTQQEDQKDMLGKLQEKTCPNKELFLDILKEYYGYDNDEELEERLRRIAREQNDGEEGGNEGSAYSSNDDLSRMQRILARINKEFETLPESLKEELSFLDESSDKSRELSFGVSELPLTTVAKDPPKANDSQDKETNEEQANEDEAESEEAETDNNNIVANDLPDLTDCDLKLRVFQDILPEIYEYLSVPDVCSGIRSCKEIKKALDKDNFWIRLLERDFPKIGSKVRKILKNKTAQLSYGKPVMREDLSEPKEIYKRLLNLKRNIRSRFIDKNENEFVMLKRFKFTEEDKASKVVPFKLKVSFVFNEACKYGNHELAEYLWEEHTKGLWDAYDAIDTIIIDDIYIRHAIKARSLPLVKFLVENVYRGGIGLSELNLAARRDHLSIVKFLLKHVRPDNSTLMSAIKGSGGNVIKYLLQKEFKDPKDHVTAFRELLSMHELKTAKHILNESSCLQLKKSDLDLAAEYGDVEIIKCLIGKKFKLKPNKETLDIVENIDIDMSFDGCPDDSVSKIIEYLLSGEFKFNLEKQDLYDAVCKGRARLMEYMVNKSGIELDDDTITALNNYIEDDFDRRFKILESISRANYDLAFNFYQDQYLLMHDLIRLGDLVGVKLAINKYNLTPTNEALSIAIECNELEIVEFLMSTKNLKPYLDDLTQAIKNNYQNLVEFIIKNSDLGLKLNKQIITRLIAVDNLHIIASLMDQLHLELDESILREVVSAMMYSSGYTDRRKIREFMKVCEFIKSRGYRLDKRVLYMALDREDNGKNCANNIHGLLEFFELSLDRKDCERIVKAVSQSYFFDAFYTRFSYDSIKLSKFLCEKYNFRPPKFTVSDLIRAIEGGGNREIIEFVVDNIEEKLVGRSDLLSLICIGYCEGNPMRFHENPFLIEYLVNNLRMEFKICEVHFKDCVDSPYQRQLLDFWQSWQSRFK